MKRKRAYKAVRVEHVRLERLLPMLASGCIVALDVAKQKFMAALATFCLMMPNTAASPSPVPFSFGFVVKNA
jgi:hypothetical protein